MACSTRCGAFQKLATSEDFSWSCNLSAIRAIKSAFVELTLFLDTKEHKIAITAIIKETNSDLVDYCRFFRGQFKDKECFCACGAIFGNPLNAAFRRIENGDLTSCGGCVFQRRWFATASATSCFFCEINRSTSHKFFVRLHRFKCFYPLAFDNPMSHRCGMNTVFQPIRCWCLLASLIKFILQCNIGKVVLLRNPFCCACS